MRISLAFLLLATLPLAAADVDLAGDWRFALDEADAGVGERWFARDLPDKIRLPGMLQAQGFGHEISPDTPWVSGLHDRFWWQRADYRAFTKTGQVKVPFLCQPPRHYLGVAWYQRDIAIPGGQGPRWVLFLERTRWRSTVWLDEREVGSCDSLVAPHEFDLGLVEAGNHRLTVRLDNRMILPYRPDAHAVSDAMGSTWNGIVGRIELRPTAAVYLDTVELHPDFAHNNLMAKVAIGNASGRAGAGRVSAGSASAAVRWEADAATELEIAVPMPAETARWDEFKPSLHRITVKLDSPSGKDSRDLVFGLRDFRTQGNEFTVNGRLTHLRGTHDGGGFPLTGHPPMDVASWRRIFGICKDWGLNHVRFHSWCPPEAAFTAADELGVYLQPEAGMWNDFNPGSDITRMLYAETERMIRAYGNHPSFVLFSPSNEPKGRWQQVLAEWVAHGRQRDPRRLYTTGTGWSVIDKPGPVATTIDYLNAHRIGGNLMRGDKAWFGRDYAVSTRGVDVPIVSHELGQWCAYPDFDVIARFTGYLRPGSYEIFRASAEARGVLDRNKDFVRASGKLQLACYKEEIEANLRTPGLAGFQLLDLHDYMGQGTALVGPLDPFWEEKGYAAAADFRAFCGPTVPLARLRSSVFTTGERLDVPCELYHYGAAPLRAARPWWKVVATDGRVLAQGSWPARDVPVGRSHVLGSVQADLSSFPAPLACRLVLGLLGSEGSNGWNLWVYPAGDAAAFPPTLAVARDWADAAPALAAGRAVLLLPAQAGLGWNSPPLDRTPFFWNRIMNPGWSRMLGMWVEAAHPALAAFPTENFGDWQWVGLAGRTRAMNLDGLPPDFRPIVQPVDDWNRNWRLGLVFEAKVGPGRLLACSADIETDLDQRPAARQLRASLVEYLSGPSFQPKQSLSPDQVRTLFFDTRIMARLGAKADGPAAAAIDGDPNTFWLAGGPRGPRHPHVWTVSFPRPVSIAGFVAMNRQNHRDHEGDIRRYRLEAAGTDATWKEIAAGELASTWEPQTVRLPAAVTAGSLRLTALDGFGTDTSAALAEFAVMYDGPPVGEAGPGAVDYKKARSESTDVDEGN